jgi:hypothetical protein
MAGVMKKTMRSLLSRRPSPSLVISVLALFVALGGTATAASVLIKSSKQIAKGAVNSTDVADNSLSGRDIKDGGIAAADLDASTRGAIQDAGTQALEAFRIQGPQNVAAGKEARVATLSNIPPGAYAIFVKTVLTAEQTGTGFFNEGDPLSGHCKTDASGDTDEARALLGTPGANSPGELTMQITRTFGSPGTVTLTCDVQPASWSASNTSIIALRLGKAPRQAVDG